MPADPRPTIVSRLRAAGCVFAEDEADLLVAATTSEPELESMVARRVSGQPLEHVLGWAEFCGLRIVVAPGVFVPRRRTQVLAREAIALARLAEPTVVVVELCCGSGAMGAALVAALGRLELYGVDIDPGAVRCARRNISPADGQVLEGDLYAPLPATLRGRVDVLVVNAPYVPTEAIGRMPPEARTYEPRPALDGGGDGLDVLRRVVVEARQWLAPGGHLLFETSESQTAAALRLVAQQGLMARIVADEDLGATVVIGSQDQPRARSAAICSTRS